MESRREKEMESIFLKIPFLVGLSEAERHEIGKRIVHRDFRRNEIILHQDETCHYLYLILSGQVKVVNMSAEGKEHILAIHEKGDFFGEMALLDGKTAPAAVVALRDGRICLISRESFLHVIMGNRAAMRGIIDLLCTRLRQAWLQIRVMSFDDAEHRVRAVLQGLGEKFGVRDSRGLIIGLGITHQNIASLSTTSRETVTRFLNKAEKSGEIEVLANKHILLKPAFTEKLHEL
ncbi:MAG: Crp/Fnr family transcriptional regulator [Thermodesulfobacteriota bacterium]